MIPGRLSIYAYEKMKLIEDEEKKEDIILRTTERVRQNTLVSKNSRNSVSGKPLAEATTNIK
jgi:hypothetical protein